MTALAMRGAAIGFAVTLLCSARADLKEENLLQMALEASGEEAIMAEGPSAFMLSEPFPLEHGSFAIWVKPVDWSSQSPEHIILAAARSDTLRFQIYKFLNDSNNIGLCFLLGKYAVDQDGFGLARSSASETNWQKGEWCHIAAIWSLEDQTLELYLDGWMIASGVITPEDFPEGDVMEMKLGSPLRATNGEYYTTEFRDPVLLKRRLTDEEIVGMIKQKPE